MVRKVILEVIAVVLFLLFLFAAALKWYTFQTYMYDMRTQPLPDWLIFFAIYGLPPLHLLTALLLVSYRTQLIGLYIAFTLMLTYTLYIAAMLFQWVDNRPCSCTGLTRNMSWEEHFVFNLTFLLLSAIGFLLQRTERRKDTIFSFGAVKGRLNKQAHT